MNSFDRLFFSFQFLLHNFWKGGKKGGKPGSSINQRTRKAKKRRMKRLTAKVGGEVNDATPAMKGPATPETTRTSDPIRSRYFNKWTADCLQCEGLEELFYSSLLVHSTSRNWIKSSNANVTKCKRDEGGHNKKTAAISKLANMELHVTTNVTWQMAKKTKRMEAANLTMESLALQTGAKFEPLRVFCIQHYGKSKKEKRMASTKHIPLFPFSSAK
jgi:hypothetical protein